MSDFVDRLLGRSALPPIRPLLPSLFEPSRRGNVDDSLPQGTFTTSSERGHDTDPARIVELVAPQPAPRAETVTSAAQEGQRAPAPEPGRVESPGIPMHQVRPDPVRAPSAAVARHRAGPATPEGPSRMDPAPPRRVAVSPSSEVSPSAPPATLQARRPAPAVVIQRSSHRTSVFERNLVASRDPASEPDVHISIGRVEITAAPPPPNPARHANTQRRPQLTLDDYLKSREG